jgi:hypothetical protein
LELPLFYSRSIFGARFDLDQGRIISEASINYSCGAGSDVWQFIKQQCLEVWRQLKYDFVLI